MLAAVREMVPELYPLIHSAYSSPSSLFFGESVLQSSEGVQQGDPLGPLLFCLTIHDMLLQLRGEFGVSYLDDGTLGGSLEEVLRDVHMVERVAGDLGLQLNHRKSEIICDDPATRQSMLAAFPQFCMVSQDHATLLGSPIGSSVEGIKDAIGAKTSALALMGDRLRLLHAHDGFCLLRNAFTLPNMLYTLRTTPCFLSLQLQKFDDLQRSLLADIANISLDANDRAWAQAALPVWSGGLGVQSASQLAPSAFWPLVLVPPSSPTRYSHHNYGRHLVLFTELLSPSGAVGMTIPPPPPPPLQPLPFSAPGTLPE